MEIDIWYVVYEYPNGITVDRLRNAPHPNGVPVTVQREMARLIARANTTREGAQNFRLLKGFEALKKAGY